MNELFRCARTDFETVVSAHSSSPNKENDLERIVSKAVSDHCARGSDAFLRHGVQGPASMIIALVVLKADPELAQRPVLTLMFVDIVQSTRHAEKMGDASWRHTLAKYRSVVREIIVLEGGREIDHAGDAFFATFERPTQAVRAARAIRVAVAEVGLEVRIGLHTGECERTDEGFEGVAVHIAARVATKARAGEILVSRTVKDLVLGSGLRFAPARRAVLKGLSQEFRLFALDLDGTSETLACV
jgi:class 3 adenylate cyclase